MSVRVLRRQEGNRRTSILAANHSNTVAAYNPILFDTVTPLGSTIDVTVHGAGIKTGPGAPTFGLDWGPPDGNGRLRGSAIYHPPLSGVSTLDLIAAGDYSALSAAMAIHEQNTLPVTPGVPIKVVWWGSVSGGFESFPATGWRTATIEGCWLPDGTKLYLTEFSQDTVQVVEAVAGPYSVIRLRTPESVLRAADSFRRRVTVGDGPYGCAAARDSTRVAVCNYTAATVSIIETLNDTVERTITVASNPVFCVWIDSTYVFVGMANGDVVKLNAVTGATSATIDLGAFPINRLAANDAGTYVYAVNEGTYLSAETKLFRITVADNSVINAWTYGEAASHVQVAYDGTVIAGYPTGTSALTLWTPALVAHSTPSVAHPGWITGNLLSTDLTAARDWLYTSYGGGGWGYMSFRTDAHYPPYTWFDAPDVFSNPLTLARLSPTSGDIYLFEDSAADATSLLRLFPNATTSINAVSGGFGPTFAKMYIDGVAA